MSFVHGGCHEDLMAEVAARAEAEAASDMLRQALAVETAKRLKAEGERDDARSLANFSSRMVQVCDAAEDRAEKAEADAAALRARNQRLTAALSLAIEDTADTIYQCGGENSEVWNHSRDVLVQMRAAVALADGEGTP